MNDIDIRRFVDINIKQHVETVISGTRDVTVLFTHEGTRGKISGVNGSVITDDMIFASFAAASKVYPKSTFPDTNAYLSMYYNNLGARIVVIEGYDYDYLQAEHVAQLDNKYILICACSAKDNAVNMYNKLKAIATARESADTVHGVNEKIIFGRTENIEDKDDVANFAVKYSKVYGAEMTMAAYLSRINVYGINTVRDYCYTAEAIDEEVITDAEYEKIITNKMNVDTYLANNIRNLGGNLKNNADMVNQFVRIVLHQTLTQRVLEALVAKLKNADGIGKLYATICNELNNYQSCGYFSYDKIWTSPTLKVTANGAEYIIIEEGTALTSGYIVRVLPMSALTLNDKALHKAPPIYVIIADQYGIRSVTINGEII